MEKEEVMEQHIFVAGLIFFMRSYLIYFLEQLSNVQKNNEIFKLTDKAINHQVDEMTYVIEENQNVLDLDINNEHSTTLHRATPINSLLDKEHNEKLETNTNSTRDSLNLSEKANITTSQEDLLSINTTHKASEAKRKSQNIWVKELVLTTKAADLKELFDKYGKVMGVKVISTSTTPGSKCFGFITMSSHEEAIVCLEKLDKTEFNGNVISISLAKSDPTIPRNVDSKVKKTRHIKLSNDKTFTWNSKKKTIKLLNTSQKTSKKVPKENENLKRDSKSKAKNELKSLPQDKKPSSISREKKIDKKINKSIIKPTKLSYSSYYMRQRQVFLRKQRERDMLKLQREKMDVEKQRDQSNFYNKTANNYVRPPAYQRRTYNLGTNQYRHRRENNQPLYRSMKNQPAYTNSFRYLRAPLIRNQFQKNESSSKYGGMSIQQRYTQHKRTNYGNNYLNAKQSYAVGYNEKLRFSDKHRDERPDYSNYKLPYQDTDAPIRSIVTKVDKPAYFSRFVPDRHNEPISINYGYNTRGGNFSRVTPRMRNNDRYGEKERGADSSQRYYSARLKKERTDDSFQRYDSIRLSSKRASPFHYKDGNRRILEETKNIDRFAITPRSKVYSDETRYRLSYVDGQATSLHKKQNRQFSPPPNLKRSMVSQHYLSQPHTHYGREIGRDNDKKYYQALVPPHHLPTISHYDARKYSVKVNDYIPAPLTSNTAQRVRRKSQSPSQMDRSHRYTNNATGSNKKRFCNEEIIPRLSPQSVRNHAQVKRRSGIEPFRYTYGDHPMDNSSSLASLILNNNPSNDRYGHRPHTYFRSNKPSSPPTSSIPSHLHSRNSRRQDVVYNQRERLHKR
ncbi:SAFB-like transcription modulator isoform X3 [Gordionus sp. m RMFG-2023]|uniref:SAFB-like transcription modulator isoform X3 n=1 Tax=Gordionus sp. m RMFG-2023 TaxID=3053472 RepID=UPI0031FCB961